MSYKTSDNLLFLMSFFIIILFVSDWHYDIKIKDLEAKIQSQQADIEELYLRSEELFKKK